MKNIIGIVLDKWVRPVLYGHDYTGATDQKVGVDPTSKAVLVKIDGFTAEYTRQLVWYVDGVVATGTGQGPLIKMPDGDSTWGVAANLKDNFDDNSYNTAKWVKEGDGAQVLEQNTQLEITHAAASEYNTSASVKAFNLTGSSMFAEIVDVGNQGLASHEAILGLRLDASNALWFTCNGGNLKAYKKVAATTTQVGSNITYNATTHKYWRIRESSGTTYWDTSTDSLTWTNRWSVANPFAVTGIEPYLQTGSTGEASGSYTYFDDFNIVDSAAPIYWDIADVTLLADTAPTGAALIVDIQTSLDNSSFTTIFSTKPEIAISAKEDSNAGVLSDTRLNPNEYVRMDVSQVGSTIAGSDLTVIMTLKEYQT